MGPYKFEMRLLVYLLSVCVYSTLCPDYEFGTRCVSICDDEKSKCRDGCDVDDAVCAFECSLELDNCIQSCPCFSQCPDGCSDCTNSICVCAHPDDNPDYVNCVDWVESVYVECLVSCQAGDVHCLSICGQTYSRMLNECPCEDGCPNGCPCDAYECPTVDTTKMLVIWGEYINASYTKILALATNSDGDAIDIEWHDIQYIDISATSTRCSVVWQNQFYLIGATSNKYQHQISRIEDCRFIRVGTLSFPMRQASCVATNDELIMAFPQDKRRTCFKGTTPFNVTEPIEDSSYEHFGVYLVASEHYALAVGHGGNGAKSHNEVELLDLRTWTWIEKSSYPFEAQFRSAKAVHVGNDQFVLFGGQTCDASNCGGHEDNHMDTIASYSTATDKWTKLGRLVTPRSGAGVSVIHGGFLIFGGTPEEDQQT